MGPDMRLNSIASSVLLLAAGLVASSTASAFGNYPGLLPNGNVDRCANCHLSAGGGGPRTPFGEDVNNNGPGVQWSLLYDLDSDGDGQTNGEELGDQCGDWTAGAAPRTTDLSNPGVDSSTSADPNTPACLPGDQDAGVTPEVDAGDEPVVDAGGEPEGQPEGQPEGEPAASHEGEPDSQAICACTAAKNATGAFSGFAVLALGGFALVGRRRRR